MKDVSMLLPCAAEDQCFATFTFKRDSLLNTITAIKV